MPLATPFSAPPTRRIDTQAPLAGGGDVSADRTLSIAAASGAAAGSLSAADKAKLDAATSAATAATLVLRDGAGNFAAATITASSVTGLSAPANATDAARKQDVDNAIAGLSAKGSVNAASTANVATLSGLQTIDGVALAASDRVLLKNQTTAVQNGAWLVASGAWTRAADFPAGVATAPGAFFFVEAGTVNGGTGWVCTNTPGYTIGSDGLTFTQVSASTTYTAGTGLSKSGNQFSIDAAYAGQTSIVTLGTITAGTWHGTPIAAAYVGSLPESQITNLTSDLAARLVAANNLSDVASAATARHNLGLGSADSPTFAQATITGSPSAGTDAANKTYVDAQITSLGAAMANVTVQTATTGGATPFKRISTADTNAASIKTAAGTLYGLYLANNSPSPRYLKLYDKASSPTVGTDTPKLTIEIPGNSSGAGNNVPIPPQGVAFANGIALAITAALADSDTTAVAAAEVVVNAIYA